jgi:hypothetical protein
MIDDARGSLWDEALTPAASDPVLSFFSPFSSCVDVSFGWRLTPSINDTKGANTCVPGQTSFEGVPQQGARCRKLWDTLICPVTMNKPPKRLVKVWKMYGESGILKYRVCEPLLGLPSPASSYRFSSALLAASGEPSDEANFSAVPGGYTALRC